MTATYDPTLPTNRDHVRLLIGDVDTTSPQLSDEEITALLSAETSTGAALKYFCAATALEMLGVRWAASGQGVEEIAIGRLKIVEGSGISTGQSIASYVCTLRTMGQRRMINGGKRFLRSI